MPAPTAQTHWHFIGGKGGVGKTTCAAALALRAARRARTLLVSTDPASSLGDVLDVTVTARPRRVRGAGDLYAVDLRAAAAFERWLEPRRTVLSRIAVRGTYLDEEDVARLMQLSLPGIDEVIGLVEIVRLSAARFAHVVIDTAPTGHTLRLLAAPALLGRVGGLLDSLQAHHRTVVSALRGRYRADESDAIIAELQADGEDLTARLRDPGRTRVSWVTLPEPMALEETADALSALAEAGFPRVSLILNRATPPPPQPCDWCSARRAFEARAVAPVSRRFGALEISALPELQAEPRGVAALRRLADLIQPWTAGRAFRPVTSRIRASQSGGTPVRPRDAVASSPRWLLVGGKGGVGKSTCAAATAIDLARADPTRRVLLLSADPAHSLGDVFGARLGDTPRQVPGAPANLVVREVDAAARLTRFRERYLASVDTVFEGMSRGSISTGGDHRAFRELIDLAPPGIDEVIAIAEVADALGSPEALADVIVTDTAPTGHALRLLETPSVLRGWTHAVMSILLKYQQVVGAGELASLLVQLSKRLRVLEVLLRDAARTEFVIVTRAAALPRAETVRLRRSLKSMGIAVGAIIVNAAGAGGCGRCQAVKAAQKTEIARLRRDLPKSGGYAIIVAPAEVPPPHGAAVLTRWSSAWRRIN